MANWLLPFSITMSYTVIAVILGVSAKGKLEMKKMENWSISGNTLGVLVLFFLTGAANISSYTFMGAPGWGYAKGVASFYVVVGLSLASFLAYFVGPRITELARKNRIITLAEGYGKRYESRLLRAITALVSGMATIGMAVIQVMGIGYILAVMSGGHVPFWLGQTIVLVAIFIYIFTSGVRAIGWTNVFQGILMFILSFTVCIIVMKNVTGGLDLGTIFNRVADISPAHLTLPGALQDMPPVFWTTSILVTMLAFWPGLWTGAASARSADTLRKSAIFLPVYYLIMVPMILVGFITVFAFTEFTGPIDQVSISFVSRQLPLWLVGIFGAAVLAASQSTCEPQFHVTALTLTRDVIIPFSKNQSAERAGKIQRLMLLPVMFGVTLPLAILRPSSMVYINLVCCGFVVQLTPLLLGLLLWPRSTKAGAFSGVMVGVIVVILCNLVWRAPLGIHAGVWGWIFNIPIHIIVSLLTKPVSKDTLDIFYSREILQKCYVGEQKSGVTQE